MDLAEIKRMIGDKMSGLGQFAMGSETLSRLAGNNPTPSAPAPPPSLDTSKALALLAEESAKRNKVKPRMTMTPAAKKALSGK